MRRAVAIVAGVLVGGTVGWCVHDMVLWGLGDFRDDLA